MTKVYLEKFNQMYTRLLPKRMNDVTGHLIIRNKQFCQPVIRLVICGTGMIQVFF